MCGDILIQMLKMFIVGGVIGLEQEKEIFDGDLIILL